MKQPKKCILILFAKGDTIMVNKASVTQYASRETAETEFGFSRQGDAAVARHDSGIVKYLDWEEVVVDHRETLKRLKCAAKG
jgi:hypothetical protein